MDFLKSAVASAISKGPAFPYSFGDRVDIDQSVWMLHNGTKREDGSKCSIFSFDVAANKSRLPLAKNAVRKLRTLRHPGVVKVLDTVETEAYIYIATERLTPLGWHTRRKSLSDETIKWGLHNIAKTLKFINSEAFSIHGAIRVSSIFTTESGEWKLGGFEILSSMKDDDAIIYNYGSLVPDSARYAPPEIGTTGWDAVKRAPVYAVDSYNYGTLMFEVFNGTASNGPQGIQTKNIPPSMQQGYRRLLNQNPKARLSVGQFLDQGERNGGFFQTPLIQLTEGIDNLGLKNDAERDEFLSQLDELTDDFPEEFFKMKVLPELLKSVEFGGGGPKVFGVVMKISTKLSDDEWDSRITPVVVRLFTSPDRALRVCLLDNLPVMIDHLSQKVVTDKIFPQMTTGFTDVVPIIREQTVKAILTVVPKLSDRIINGELLRYLAKTANDDQPGIRTNTTICLGKIARNLGAGSRSKVLIAAFARALRDPFVHARNAALLAFAATADLFSEDDCASKILPSVCPSLIDKEKIVRDQASKTLDVYLARIRKYTQTMPDSVLPPTEQPSSAGVGASLARMSTPSAAGDPAGASWAGWAISSFTNKLTAASGNMQSASAGVAAPTGRPSSVPPGGEVPRKTTPTPGSSNTASALHRQTLSKPGTPSNASAFSPPPVVAQDSAFDDFGGWDVDDADEGANGWGGGDDDNGNAEEPDPWAKPAAAKRPGKAPAATFDDGGEPDFAGWLNAQAQAKHKAKGPLPKGLGAKGGAAAGAGAAGRPSAVGAKAHSTGGLGGTKKTVGAGAAGAAGAAKKNVVVPKKAEVKEAEEEEEGWGDAWE
ncbi:armadillo-type protein [Lineolata rhizophorae]|uniref:Armadillo-type protein n=1 Tax=Lineolata rhizophorae TaxID=578093 RepID=A0A6A6PC76_9PEZI|nr:armadillo-type protein [Lineolata rhizophorae]